MTEYLSVSTLTKYLKAKFERDPYLERVYLTGKFQILEEDLIISILPLKMKGL